MTARTLVATLAATSCLLLACDRDVAPMSEARDLTRPSVAPTAADAAGPERENRELRDTLARERAAARVLEAAHRDEVAALEAELRKAVESRLEREHQWQTFTRGISSLAVGTEAEVPEFAAPSDGIGIEPDGVAPEPQELDAAEKAAAALAQAAAIHERSQAIARTLRSLFIVEEISGLELLECGELADGAIGPVVMRVRDGTGRSVGTLCADRLRLEVSRAARTLSLVLEHGYERRGEMRVPFERDPQHDPQHDPSDTESTVADPERRGVRRIQFPEIDPVPWIRDLPELCGASTVTEVIDDGRWDLRAVRAAMNVLLREDAEHGYYRVRGIGGVKDGVLIDVALDQLDRDGQIRCKLFADRLEVAIEGSRVQIVLESGAQMKGDAKTPFLDGRYRIYLPRADVDAWTRAGIPGVSPLPHSEKP